MNLPTDLSLALAAVDRIVSTTSAEQAAMASPCEGWDAGQVIDHLVQSLNAFVSGFGGEVPAATDSRTLNFRNAAEQLVMAIDAHKDETVKLPWGESPADVARGLALVEVVVHGWDIATAEGRTLRVDDALVGRVRQISDALMAQMGDTSAAFKPAVEAPADASPLDSLVASLGRQPVQA